MKYLALLLAVILPLASTSCDTLNAPNTGAIVDIAAQYGIAKHLAGAKNLEQFQSRQADLAALAAVLGTVNNTSDAAALRNLVAAKFGNKPEVLLLTNILLTYYQPAGREPRHELLTKIVAALTAASQQPAPAF